MVGRNKNNVSLNAYNTTDTQMNVEKCACGLLHPVGYWCNTAAHIAYAHGYSYNGTEAAEQQSNYTESSSPLNDRINQKRGWFGR